MNTVTTIIIWLLRRPKLLQFCCVPRWTIRPCEGAFSLPVVASYPGLLVTSKLVDEPVLLWGGYRSQISVVTGTFLLSPLPGKLQVYIKETSILFTIHLTSRSKYLKHEETEWVLLQPSPQSMIPKHKLKWKLFCLCKERKSWILNQQARQLGKSGLEELKAVYWMAESDEKFKLKSLEEEIVSEWRPLLFLPRSQS